MTEKWVRVMADYSSDGLWHHDGCMMGREDLPISGTLKDRHAAWCEIYEQTEFYLPDEQQTNRVDMQAFASEGLAIARAICAELPDWTVVYFDESKYTPRFYQARHEYEYEVSAP